MEKTAAGPVKSRSSKGEAVRKAMTRRGLGIITFSMAENVSDMPILPPRASRAHLDGSVPETGPGRSDSSDCGGTNREGGAYLKYRRACGRKWNIAVPRQPEYCLPNPSKPPRHAPSRTQPAT